MPYTEAITNALLCRRIFYTAISNTQSTMFLTNMSTNTGRDVITEIIYSIPYGAIIVFVIFTLYIYFTQVRKN